VSNLSSCVFRKSNERHFGLTIEAAELVNLDLSWSHSRKLILASESGRRVELNEKVHPNSKSTLLTCIQSHRLP
jgi:hypothetical protein